MNRHDSFHETLWGTRMLRTPGRQIPGPVWRNIMRSLRFIFLLCFGALQVFGQGIGLQFEGRYGAPRVETRLLLRSSSWSPLHDPPARLKRRYVGAKVRIRPSVDSGLRMSPTWLGRHPPGKNGDIPPPAGR